MLAEHGVGKNSCIKNIIIHTSLQTLPCATTLLQAALTSPDEIHLTASLNPRTGQPALKYPQQTLPRSQRVVPKHPF